MSGIDSRLFLIKRLRCKVVFTTKGSLAPRHAPSGQLSSRVCFVLRAVRVCVAFQLRVSVAVLLELTELAKPVERLCLCCNTLPAAKEYTVTRREIIILICSAISSVSSSWCVPDHQEHTDPPVSRTATQPLVQAIARQPLPVGTSTRWQTHGGNLTHRQSW